MIRKSFVFILFVLLGVGIGRAQTPEPKQERESAPRAFSLAFDGSGGYLGVQTEDVSKDNFGKYSLSSVRGVGVANVTDGSPAQTAGLQKGDVILKVNGEDVTSTRKLSRLVNEIAPDHQARLTIARGGSEREISVTVGKRPGPTFGEGSFTWSGPIEKFEIPELKNFPDLRNLPRSEGMQMPPIAPDAPMVFTFSNRRQIGVGVMPLGKQLAEHFGVQSGVLVSNVREDSAAAKAGIKAGDVITEVDGKAINGDFDLIRAIGEKKEGSVTLTVVRDRNRRTISVTPEEVKGGFENHFEMMRPGVPVSPQTPGSFRMERPMVPGAPFPFGFPGRVI